MRGGIALCIVAFFQYRLGLVGLDDASIKYPLLDPLCPWIVTASLMIFTGFSMLSIKRDLSRMASKTFYVYLIHAGVWRLLNSFVKVRYDSRLVIPAGIVIVYLISQLAAGFFERANSRLLIYADQHRK